MIEKPLEITLEQLRGMIGVAVRYGEGTWEVIEVLEDGPSLVLRDVTAHTRLQHDQYGDPGRRRVVRTETVPVVDETGCALHPAFLALELLEE